ncbi:sulfite reductase subunit alpha [Horticoccus sp. 23ND18S-11]|uniref:sulfite reductase subunit alpha n=1 Tax=Horticoccus sp. 23ND18S-11 TaxID=3391832 RepID=UPI0039C9B807
MNPLVPFVPDSAPFTAEQRAWLNGFLAGLFSRTPAQAAAAVAAPPLVPLTILFASQTGTSEGLAKRAAKEAGKRGFAATVLDLGQTDAGKLSAEKNVLLITSTYGDGEPPDSAKDIHSAMLAASQAPTPAPQLASLRYSVCALGDTNYTQFCKCGADFDLYFEKLGGTRIAPRVDCDLDYEEKFSAWLNAALTAFGPAPSGAAAPAVPAAGLEASTDVATGYSKQNPFPATLLASHNLNAPGSAKQVHHIAFDLADSGLAYEAGDALGVMPHNCPALVADVLATLGCDGEEAVTVPDGTTTSLRRALTEIYDLGKPSADLLALCTLVPAGDAASVQAKAAPLHVIDALLAAPGVKPAPADFVRALKKIRPRLYSISSSPKAHAGEVHLTVGAVRYELHGRARKGVCSTFLSDRAVPGETRVGVFVHANPSFRPPQNGDTPMIMVGPGTGIAPFRAFLHERKASGAKGRNWLLFGDQRAATDFLYQEELATLQREGVLTRLDTAFSRDQAEKIYVQQRMLEHAAELYAWLEAGAHFYVCGDASRMAKDVDAALHQVVERAGGKSPAQAAAYVQALKGAKRYARDVY